MTKKRIAFVTDSTAFLTEELRNHPDIYVVPIVVISDGKEYEDGIDLSSDQLYEIIRNEKQVPKTSQPSAGRFKDLYDQLKEKYDSAIAIHVSNKLSGTISSSKTGKDHSGFDVEMVDSYSLSYAITALLQKGIELAEEGLDNKQIAEELRGLAKKSRNLILLGSLEQLYKGGRMSGAQFLLGNFLKIKPILSIDTNGELGLIERIRSEKKATSKVVNLFKEAYESKKIKQLGIMHGNAINKAMEMKELIEAEISGLPIEIGEISSSLAVHAGEGTLGLFWNEE
ncbi:DegV family protein [Ornithinibacillus halophilus]|uniref:EDD domain protein, DegV family n=1 Tax=Ornithinibacillus halophilus TaxID=930117 RepID=A0A1M5IGI4_9BACI|nr:DegV family protein [Ornithinibacillus halophilus]SHG27335.1 EDD domain protein, DegV family [Ornithinibacillus halophilus]